MDSSETWVGSCGPNHYGGVFDGERSPIAVLWKGSAVRLVLVKLGAGPAV